METDSNRIAVAMDGARRHYDVAEALDIQRCLEQLYADWYAPPGSMQHMFASLLQLFWPAVGKRMRERYSPRISSTQVSSNPRLAIEMQLCKRKYDMSEEFFVWSSKKTADWIKHVGLGNANGLYGYIRNIDPELCRFARTQGLKVLGEQMIAPARIEQQEYDLQQAKWPGWERPTLIDTFQIVSDVEEATWENVDRIIAPSEYVIDGLRRQGIDTARVDLVPYPADFHSHSLVDRSHRKKNVTIGFVGHINLRKNAPVFLEVAKRLSSRYVKFVMVGKSYLNELCLERYSEYVEFTGHVSRSEVAKHLSRFDIFLFPSTCEGSAAVVLEAMSTGLPIVTTNNSGTAVTDGVDGFLCNPDDIEGISNRIEQLARDPCLRLTLGRSAASRVCDLTLDQYGKSIIRAFNNCKNAANS